MKNKEKIINKINLNFIMFLWNCLVNLVRVEIRRKKDCIVWFWCFLNSFLMFF